LSIGLLIVGISYYLLFRSPIITSQWLGLESLHQEFKLPIALDWLPSFIHQFSFVLLTWLALDRTHKWFALLFWLIVNTFFELIQILPIKNFILSGTYSHTDMISILVASLLAYIIIQKK